MVYNEWGELVDPAELRADPASKDMDARAMFRLILLNWHYRVSPCSFFSDRNAQRRAILNASTRQYHRIVVIFLRFDLPITFCLVA